MAVTKYKGTGSVSIADFKEVKFEGLTKGGKPVVITLHDAINMGNIDWAFAEKGETVAQVVFTACYDNTDEMSSSTEEPWDIDIETTDAASDCIMLGAGKVSIGGTPILLTRGGSQFNTNRTFRDINADGDRGSVKGRVTMDEARATLTLNALEIINKFTALYPAIEAVTG